LTHSRRFNRRTQHERLGEMPNRTNLWNKLFPIDKKKAETLNRVRLSIKRKAAFQTNAQRIGKIREEKVRRALQSLKDKKKITSFLSTIKFSFSDLIEGIDFRIIYIDKKYEIFDFSVTGKRWVEEHQERHPEIPIIAVRLREDRKSIERKILELLDKSKKLC